MKDAYNGIEELYKATTSHFKVTFIDRRYSVHVIVTDNIKALVPDQRD